jgi:hypothetical protein
MRASPEHYRQIRSKISTNSKTRTSRSFSYPLFALLKWFLLGLLLVGVWEVRDKQQEMIAFLDAIETLALKGFALGSLLYVLFKIGKDR